MESDNNGLIVFPSNKQLCLRAHGMADTTLRRHLASLVECGLIIRRDSPNGKRYAHKSKAGEVEEAFGLSLAPLLIRAGEIAAAAEEVRAEARLLKRTRERITLQRRDVAKLIDAAIEEGVSGGWKGVWTRFRAIVDAIPRRASTLELTPILANLDAIRAEVDKALEIFTNDQIQSGNVSHNGRQQTDSNPDSHFDLEPAKERSRTETTQTYQLKQLTAEQGREHERVEAEPATVASREFDADAMLGEGIRARETNTVELVELTPLSDRSPVLVQSAGPAMPPASKTYPLPLVLKACPDIIDYAKTGEISSWREFVTTAAQVRTYLGVSPSAWDDACEAMGDEAASIVIACILQRADQIQSPGGYLRALTDKAKTGEFSPGPMIMAGISGKRKSQGRAREHG